MAKALISIPLHPSTGSSDILIEASVAEGQSGFLEAAADGTPIRVQKSVEQAVFPNRPAYSTNVAKSTRRYNCTS